MDNGELSRRVPGGCVVLWLNVNDKKQTVDFPFEGKAYLSRIVTQRDNAVRCGQDAIARLIPEQPNSAKEHLIGKLFGDGAGCLESLHH